MSIAFSDIELPLCLKREHITFTDEQKADAINSAFAYIVSQLPPKMKAFLNGKIKYEEVLFSGTSFTLSFTPTVGTTPKVWFLAEKGTDPKYWGEPSDRVTFSGATATTQDAYPWNSTAVVEYETDNGQDDGFIVAWKWRTIFNLGLLVGAEIREITNANLDETMIRYASEVDNWIKAMNHPGAELNAMAQVDFFETSDTRGTGYSSVRLKRV